MLQSRISIGFILSAILTFIYNVQLSTFILGIALWVPMMYDILYMPKNFYWFVLIAYGHLGMLATLYYYENDKTDVFLIVISVSISDLLQYVIGKNFGTHLIGGPSPKKTWEGYTGCIITSILFGYTFGFLKILFICIIGALGDLFESICKRGIGVSDSSNLLGDHGGWFDRIDGIYMTMIIFSIIYLE